MPLVDETINFQLVIFQFIGGLGLFLLGIKFMGDGLQQLAGDRLRNILDKFTTNPLLGVLAGMLVTILIQSSSGTTVLTVALVNAGFMTLRQAIGVIMGANIGTTVTAFIIGINITEYSLPFIALGAFLLFFFKNEKTNNIGQAVFGFGALFFGLQLMSTGMSPLRASEFFIDLTIKMSEHPLLGVIIGTLFTVIVQSSSATIGILQGLYSEAAITIDAAIPVLFGDNIGTTITAILAALTASVAARRAAATHVLFNIIGTIIFVILLKPFQHLILFLQDLLSLNPAMTLAFAHGSFNIFNTAIQFPFIGALAYIVTKIIPGEDVIVEYKPKHIDPLFIQQSTPVALGQAKAEVIRMGEDALRGLEETRQFVISGEKKHADISIQIEGALNNLDKEITNYLIKVASIKLTEEESVIHTILMDTVRDIERVGDHFENIVELINFQQSNKIHLTDQAYSDLNNMFQLTIDAFQISLNALKQMDQKQANIVIQKEEKIDKMEREYRKKHILRMNEGLCTADAGIVFVDIVSNLERIADHAVNIAEEVFQDEVVTTLEK